MLEASISASFTLIGNNSFIAIRVYCLFKIMLCCFEPGPSFGIIAAFVDAMLPVVCVVVSVIGGKRMRLIAAAKFNIKRVTAIYSLIMLSGFDTVSVKADQGK